MPRCLSLSCVCASQVVCDSQVPAPCCLYARVYPQVCRSVCMYVFYVCSCMHKYAVLVCMPKYAGVYAHVQLQKRVTEKDGLARWRHQRTRKLSTSPHRCLPVREALAPAPFLHLVFYVFSLFSAGRTCAVFIESPVFQQQRVAAHQCAFS